MQILIVRFLYFCTWKHDKLPESNVISLTMIHLAAKYNRSLMKRPTLLCNLMLTFLDVSNILSSMYVYVNGSDEYTLPPTLNKTLASENTWNFKFLLQSPYMLSELYVWEGEKYVKSSKASSFPSRKQKPFPWYLFVRQFRVYNIFLFFVVSDGKDILSREYRFFHLYKTQDETFFFFLTRRHWWYIPSPTIATNQ